VLVNASKLVISADTLVKTAKSLVATLLSLAMLLEASEEADTRLTDAAERADSSDLVAEEASFEREAASDVRRAAAEPVAVDSAAKMEVNEASMVENMSGVAERAAASEVAMLLIPPTTDVAPLTALLTPERAAPIWAEEVLVRREMRARVEVERCMIAFSFEVVGM